MISLKSFFYMLMVFVLSFSLSGCFEEKISCNDSTVVSLVRDTTEEVGAIALDNLARISTTKDKYEKKQMLFMLNSGAIFGFQLAAMQVIENAQNYITDIRKKLSFSIDNFVTVDKKMNGRRLTCQAKIMYALPDFSANFNVEYIAQLSDDDKQVQVELKSINYIPKN